MIKIFRKIILSILAAVTGLMGFSCNFLKPVVYGPPPINENLNEFYITGKVVTKAGKGIMGIKVLFKETGDFVFTDESGDFSVRLYINPQITEMTVVFEDIDGKENQGSFKMIEKIFPVGEDIDMQFVME